MMDSSITVLDDNKRVGKISYLLAQTFEHSGGRSFRRIHLASSMLGVSRFAHLSSGSILVRIPDQVKLTVNYGGGFASHGIDVQGASG